MEDERQDPRTEEAIRWLVKLRDEDASELDRRGFSAWLAEDPRNQAAWQRANNLWSRLDIIGADRNPAGREVPVLASSRPQSYPSDARSGWASRFAGRGRWIAAAAAVLVLAVASYAWVHPELFADYRTSVAQRSVVTLTDGSVVELGGGTAISVRFDRTNRRLRLFEGEAFFKVSPDPARPFIVEAFSGRTTAVGTAFDVKESGTMVTVAVAEHAVDITLGPGTSARVNEGQQISYGPDGLEAVHSADLAAVEAWRDGRLVFQDAPLSQVVAELERYRHGRIILDSRISHIPVTAVFNTDRTDEALQTIGAILPVRVFTLTDWLVFLSPRGDSASTARSSGPSS